MNALRTALDRIKALQAVLAEPPESWDPRTAPGKQVQRRNAEEEINTIQDGFKKLVSAEVAKIFVIGTKPKKLAEARQIASEMGAVVVDADALYKRLATPALPLYEQARKVTIDMALVVENDIMTAAEMHKIIPTDFPRLNGNALGSVLSEPERQIQDLARAAVETICGTEMQQSLVTQLVFSEVMRLDQEEIPVPVVIVGIRSNEIDDFERRGFFAGRPQVVVNVDNSKNIEASLKSAAARIMKQLQPSTSESETEVVPEVQ